MYIKTKGSNFTVQNKNEEKDIISYINTKLKENKNNIYDCVGVSCEQFTGKIKSLVLKIFNSTEIQICSVDGTYPTMHLINPKTSSIVATIKFEISEKQINSICESLPVKEEDKIVIVEEAPKNSLLEEEVIVSTKQPTTALSNENKEETKEVKEDEGPKTASMTKRRAKKKKTD